LSNILKPLTKAEALAKEEERRALAELPLVKIHLFAINHINYVAIEVLRRGTLHDIIDAADIGVDTAGFIHWTSSFTYMIGHINGKKRFPEADIQEALKNAGRTLDTYSPHTMKERFPLLKETHSDENEGVLTRVAYIFLDKERPYHIQAGKKGHCQTLFLSGYGRGSIIFALGKN
jgi:hypothetical protein